MKQKLYMSGLVFLLVMMLASISSLADNTLVMQNAISLDNQSKSFYLEKDQTNRHPLVITEAGELTLKFTGYGFNYVRILDADYVRIGDADIWGSEATPETESFTLDLIPGTYYVQYEFFNTAGSYSVKADFTAAGNNEAEPNDSFMKAMELSYGQKVTGFLTKNLNGDSDYKDLNDYYQFTVNKEQKVKITYYPEKGNGIINLYDSEYVRKSREWLYGKVPYIYEETLTPGIYYILIESANEAGAYTIKVEEAVTTEPPTTETPATETPATETPATETPATETPDKEVSEGSVISDSKASYTVNVNTNTVTYMAPTYNSTTVTIPVTVTIGGTSYEVTAISNNAFYNNTTIKNVTISNNVTSIGANAFYGCTNLTNITIGNNVTTIDNNAFYNCINLTSIKIGNNVTTIGNHAFYNCINLTNIKIGNNVTTIGNYAFYNCKKLKIVKLNNKVQIIGAKAFMNCTSLTKVTISKSVKIIGKQAFYNCKRLKTLKLGSKVQIIEAKAFMNCTSLTKVTIPSSVKSIGKMAFYNCKKLKKVTIKSKMLTTKTVGSKAFAKVNSKVTIKVPKNLLKEYKKLLIKRGVSKNATIKN